MYCRDDGRLFRSFTARSMMLPEFETVTENSTVLGSWLAGATAFYWGRTVIRNLKMGRESPVDKLLGRFNMSSGPRHR